MFLTVCVTVVAQDTTVVASVQRNKDGTRIYSDSAIYQGMSIKIDLFTPILEVTRSKGKVQSYEISMNWRLKQRIYPTLELGYAMADITADGGHHIGKGGFGRVGVDINGLKKNPSRLNALLVGFRVGTAVQNFSITEIPVNSPYWNVDEPYHFDFEQHNKADVWGEVVMGCQVQVWEGFQMGWDIRLKILMTRTDKKNHYPLPGYIPGFGYRDETNWGINYYIGYHF